ncbi:hypothetical protein [Paenibacillus lemnae]|uniref:Uncharacterized protein n=1 Tax=Paenibacillus lemnae TaxID=1330551 RepID=A0A848M0P0_PAELE|nr:hypothetical protein [Paenibacillus lemnae]NMO94335.1 hypothetical protein [Paenibacillus lemnae]
MLYVRHAVGSRLFYETTEYEIMEDGEHWSISFPIGAEDADILLQFRDELNIFHVEQDHLKTWYYSSEGNVTFAEDEGRFTITADHQTVYPV